MKVVISPKAEKEFRRLSKIDQIATARKIRQLGGPLAQEEKLKGFSNIFRVRVGDFRIVFKKTPDEIYIILISHRKDIYNLLKRLF
ncbi:type II toxin-antitoxin system RelE/ParE family toxin [Candidatus Gottesmanbacteria bacterium]|nr:type II toxin-antitoxin system RelE/ParE family toxin [Candidatus Gottesmanbacteria bacterium]MBI5465265.1 type II toxin-antitoxin system RelE/ParE family toxin [Candidatus Gottesmanbacteria bacterium]